MFTNIVQPNMNGVGRIPFASNIQVNNINGQKDINENGLDTNSFIKILAAVLSGLNNTAMMNKDRGLFAGKDGQPINISELKNNLFVDSDGNVVAGDALSGILQQMMLQLPVASNQSSMGGNTIDNAILNLMIKSEDGMQKALSVERQASGVKLSHNAGRTTLDAQRSTHNASSVEGQASGVEHKASSIESQVSDIKLSHDAGRTTLDAQRTAHSANMHIKTTLQNVLNVEGQASGVESQALHAQRSTHNASSVESQASDIKLSHDAPRTTLHAQHTTHDAIASASQLYNTPYVKNDSAIVVKEPIHVSRLHELGEVMEKTVRAGDKHLIIKLEPPDLGSIQIKLRMDNGMLRADLKVDSPVVKELFSMAIPQIKASLEDSGIKVSNFFVDVKEDYYSDGRRQQDDTNQQNKQNKKQENFFDYFA